MECPTSSRSRVPTFTMALITGMSSWPTSVNEYSTEGGEEGSTSRETTPFASRSRSRAVSILGEICGMSRFSSPKRRGPPESIQMRFGDHTPPNSFMQTVIGQPGGGGGALLLRTFRAMAVGSYRAVTGFTVVTEELQGTNRYLLYIGNYVSVHSAFLNHFRI